MARAAFFFVFSILVFNFLILMISAADSNNNGDNSGNGGNSGGNGNNNGGNSNNGGGNSGSNGNSNGGNGNNGGGNSNNNGNNNGGNTNNNGNSNGGNNNGNNNGGNNGGNGNNNNNGGGSQGNNNNNGNNGNNHNGGGNNNNNGNGNNNNNAAGGNNNNNGNNGNGNNNNNSGNNGNNNNNNNNNGNKGNNNNNNGNNGNNNNNNGSNNNNSNNGNNNNNNGNNGNSSNVGKPIEYKFVGPVEIGVNWGNIASHPLPAKIIVQMLKDNNIKKAKLFDADAESVKALAGTGIEVMVAVPNGMLLDMATEYRNAKDWVKENVTEYVKDGSVKIKYVAVGNEPFLKSYNDSFTKDTYPALVHIQKAIDEAGFGKTIKATVPLNADVYESKTNLPSDGAFRSDIKGEIMKILKFLEDHDSPFVVNIYPFLSLYENPDFPSEFAFFEHGRSVQDGNLNYDNVLDANYDTLLWSLKKAGVPDLTIIIGEIGWPTDGHKAANVKSAQKFYDGLFKKLASKQGTPMRPKTEFDVYLFGFLDEDAKSIAPGKFERHWGIFRYDGQPKFPIDFSGRGQNKMPVGAKNVKYYDKKWCVFDKGVKDFSLVPPQFKKACDEGDCTAIAEGASCSWLDNLTQISYAFNMYFQINKQDDDACDFDGLALIEKKNASVGNCLFPIQIDSSAVSWMKMKSPTAIMATIVNAVILFTWLM